MEPNNGKISAEEAQLALDSLDDTRARVFLLFRPPMWLNLICSLCAGLATLSTAFSGGSSLWTFVSLVSAALLVVILLVWSWSLRMQGCIPKAGTLRSTNFLFNVSVAAAIALSIIGTQTLYQQGATWLPYLSAAMICAACGFLLYKLPTGEWIKGGNIK